MANLITVWENESDGLKNLEIILKITSQATSRIIDD